MQRIVILCLFSYVACFDFVPFQTKSNPFDVKPGGQVGEFEKEWLGFKCKFTYQSQGGTHEQWLMHQRLSEDSSKVACTVERDGAESYLFFQAFKLEVSGAKVVEAAADGESHKPLGGAEYKFEPENGAVKDVPGTFGNHLTSVSLFAVRSKQEL